MRYLMFLLMAFAPMAHAGEVEDVRAFFDNLVARTNAFDAGIASLYSPDARMITVRDGTERMEMSGAEWHELATKVMPLAKRRGDTSTYEDVDVVAHGPGFRVTARRIPAVKCVADDNYHLDVVKVDGSWRVTEEYTETVSMSQCEPSEALAASLAAMLKGLRPLLPLDLDEDTRLEAVELVGPTLIYHQRLHTIAAAEMDLEKLIPMLRQIGWQNACGAAEMKALIDQGAGVRYAFVDREGTQLTHVDISPGLCP